MEQENNQYLDKEKERRKIILEKYKYLNSSIDYNEVNFCIELQAYCKIQFKVNLYLVKKLDSGRLQNNYELVDIEK